MSEFTKKASNLFAAKGKYNLADYSSKLAKLTDSNEHAAARVLAATLTGHKETIEVAKAIETIQQVERENPISQYSYKISQRIDYLGRKAYGEDEWNEYIYSNM